MNAQPKHTPGPWAAEAALSSDVSHIRYIAADCGIIASVRHRVGQEQDEALANAKLMAAAPEMLAALKSAESLLQKLYESPNHTGVKALPFIDAELNSIRAVIGKAMK